MEEITFSCKKDASVLSVVDRFCRRPDPINSWEEAERAAHRDLVNLTFQEAKAELTAIGFMLGVFPDADPWFTERASLLRKVVQHAA